jgi:hypothetical protein
MSVGSGMGARAPLTSFVGRRTELGRLRSLTATSRLVTITGPGGSGKTRLAEEFVTSLERSFGGRVAFAYLANAGTPSEVIDVIAGAVGLRSRTGERSGPAGGPGRVAFASMLFAAGVAVQVATQGSASTDVFHQAGVVIGPVILSNLGLNVLWTVLYAGLLIRESRMATPRIETGGLQGGTQGKATS